MAIISKRYLFSWKDFEELGDLERLQLIQNNMPDEMLMQTLERIRGNGRDDNPVRATWNSLLAGIIFEHKSIESLRRELKRNAQLRELCGFNPLSGVSAVPSSSAYSRFLIGLLKQESLIDEIFHSLVEAMRGILPDFGKEIAFDGKAINSLARRKKKCDQKAVEITADRRRDDDADWGVKTYKGVREDGVLWEKVRSWFGFRLHLIADAQHELPIAFEITKASKGEQSVIRQMFDDLADTHPELVDNCEYGMGDKGYDSAETIKKLWNEYGIKPIIDIRNMWKDGEETRQLNTRDFENVTHDYKGTIFCHCPTTGEIRQMPYGGFEKDRETLKYHCPAKQYGIDCKGAKRCPFFNKSIRIPLNENRRIFTPVARSSYKWKTLYNKRTSIERVNSRLDVSFGFEKHYIRGLKKMKLRCGLALCVMLSMALGRARQNKNEMIRSLVKAA